MPIHEGREPAVTASGATQRDVALQRSWQNWVFLSTTFVVTTLGLSVIIATLLPDRILNPWPWIRTDLALVAACVFMVVTLIVHLSIEQRQLDRIHSQFEGMQAEMTVRAHRRLYALLNVSRLVGGQTTTQAIFDCITRSCVEFFNCDQASLMLCDEKRQKLIVRSANGHLNPSKVLGTEKGIGEGVAGWVAKTKKAIILGREEGMPGNPDVKLTYKHIAAAIIVPILLRDELVGVVNISSRSPNVRYTEEDLSTLEVFAENAGACIRQAERAEWMRQTIENLRAQLERRGETMPASQS